MEENFRVFAPKNHSIPLKTQLFLKIFAEKFCYYENTIYLCDIKIKLLVNLKLQDYGTELFNGND